MKNTFIFALLFAIGCYNGSEAQPQEGGKAAFSIESRITNLLQGGYELSLFYQPSGNFSFGIQVAGQDINGRAKDLLFSSSAPENLTIRLPWLVAFKTRYHLKDHKEGLYGELSIGAEQFSIASGDEIHRNRNGFILPSIGYLWHPWNREGFYVNTALGWIYAFSRENEKLINGTSYELRPFFPSPAVSVGWKF